MASRGHYSEQDGISKHQGLVCLLNRFTQAQIKENIKVNLDILTQNPRKFDLYVQ